MHARWDCLGMRCRRDGRAARAPRRGKGHSRLMISPTIAAMVSVHRGKSRQAASYSQPRGPATVSAPARLSMPRSHFGDDILPDLFLLIPPHALDLFGCLPLRVRLDPTDCRRARKDEPEALSD